jgi:hypothetical protein
MHNLSRRHLVTAAAALPALAGSAFAADHPDAKFVALGERLKVANAEADRLGKPVHRLHGACMKAARFEEDASPTPSALPDLTRSQKRPDIPPLAINGMSRSTRRSELRGQF